MYNKKLWFAFIALLVICNDVYGKKTKKNKRTKDKDETTTIQPNVVAYSTFGFNDVGSYDGFVPTSPEYSSFLSGVNQESSTRLYAPAFPSAADSTGFSGNYGSPSFDGQSYGVNENGAGQNGMSQYTANSINFLGTPNFGAAGEKNQNTDSEDANTQHAEDSDAPVYGAKIGTRHRDRPNYPINNSEYGASSGGYPVSSDHNKYFNFDEPERTQEKPSFSETNLKYQSTNNYEPSHSPQESEDYGKPESLNAYSGLDFPRVVDFTKLSSKYYPTELDTSKLTSDSMKHSNQQMSMVHSQIDSSFKNALNKNKVVDDSPEHFMDHYNLENNEEPSGKNVFKSNTFFEPNFTNKYVASHHKYSEPNTKKTESKKKINHKPWTSGNYSNAFKDWKDSSATSTSSVNGYGYSTNFSNMSFKYGVTEPKKPFSHDEIEPASSNIVDLSSYQRPEKDYNNFKKLLEFNEDEYPSASTYKEKFKSSDYLNPFKNSFSAPPTTTSSHWGNAFNNLHYSAYADHPKKGHYSNNDVNNDEVVNIPRRPQKLFTKATQNKQIDWSFNPYRSQKFNKPTHDWTKDFLDTRYKSEEDLLGLRTHDTSRPSYLPTYKPSNNVADHNEDNDFKQLVEKWKESYINSKYKDVRDNGYWSEKPEHVAVPRPHPIEVPHPVIVPVPHPFPVRVPISRPVAVPVLRELTVPIEKPVPYPVYKHVPYPVEKLVPVTVEKEVAVPVEKPYPVHIPYVRPVFHHVKPVHEDPEHLEDEDYLRRPEYKKPSQYKKKPPYGSRNRTRRPSRATYQDRNRRRWPERRRPSKNVPDFGHYSRPTGFKSSSPYRHQDFDHEADEDEHSSYSLYCRKTGNC